MSSGPSNPFSDSNLDPKPSPFSPNPYQTPNFVEPVGVADGGGIELSPSILTQQRVVTILMIVQGGLSSLMGVLVLVLAGIIPAMIEMGQANNAGRGGPPPEFTRTMTIGYVVVGVCNLLVGILQVCAGAFGIVLRGYTLGLVALVSGLLTITSCYCFPTSLALLVYGMIIYCHSTTRTAFQLAREGRTYNELMRLAAMRG
jgi:hypothetical protein